MLGLSLSGEEETKQLKYERQSLSELDEVNWAKAFNETQLYFLTDNLPDNSPEFMKAAETLNEAMDIEFEEKEP